MTWVDLGALTIVLWSGVKGYLCGVKSMVWHLCGLAAALLAASQLQKPFASYLNTHWQAGTFFVVLLTRNVEGLLKTGVNIPGAVISLPPLVHKILMRLPGTPAATVIANSDNSHAVAAGLLVQLTALVIFLILLAAMVSLVLRITAQRSNEQPLPEWQRLLGLFAGKLHGTMLALVLCVVLDALTIILPSALLAEDLHSSYLYLLTESLLSRL